MIHRCLAYCEGKRTKRNWRKGGDVSFFRQDEPALRAVTVRPKNDRIDIYNLIPDRVPKRYQVFAHHHTRFHLRVPLTLWGPEVEALVDRAFNE